MVLAAGALGNNLIYVDVAIKEVPFLVAISVAAWKPELAGWMSVLAGLWSLPVGFPFLCTGTALTLGIFARKKGDKLGVIGIFLGILSCPLLVGAWVLLPCELANG